MPQYIYLPAPDDGPRLKDPDTFTGKDPSKLPLFINQCVLFFYAKPRKYATDRDKVLFAASFLRDTASKWWMPVFTQDPPPTILDSWQEFTTELFDMFGNKHLQTTAQNTLMRLKMKDNSRVTEYLVEFNSHAAYTGWNDVALAGHFYVGLPDRIKDMFQYIDKPQTFTDMRQHALNFDQRYWERQEELGKKPANTEKSTEKKGESSADGQKEGNANEQSKNQKKKNRRGNNPNQTTDKPATTSTSNNPSSSTTTATTSTAKPASSSSQPRGPLSQEEKDRRRREGLCLYCGESGHTYSYHKNLATKKTAATAPTNPPTGRATITLTTNTDNAAPPSGKETPTQKTTEAS
jgi:Retrotransposon gag protein